MAVVWGKDARGLHILRRRSEEGPIEAALAQRLVEGRPITGEVISMRQREDLPFLFDVTTELDASGNPGAADGPSGPAKVATNSYRKGWDAIWGRRAARGPVN